MRLSPRLWPFALALALAGCQVPPLEQVVDGKGCDGDAGHGCAPGYLCCRGGCIPGDQACCLAEDDATFCARLGRICGVITDTDNCGDPRTADCGAETDAAFCARYRKQCGPYTNIDACGVSRTADCGACTTAPNLTCQNNTCVCVPDTAAQLCARLGVQCGTATGMDNCGTTRTVTCPTCTSPKTCGGGGTAGQCGCIAVGSTGCGTGGTVCCAGACGGVAPAHCCLALGDPCAGGISGECCTGSCGSLTNTCCRATGSCTLDVQCCSGICDTTQLKCAP